MSALRATVRLQLHAGFNFDDAVAQVDYFARLGVSHLYLSPIAMAVPGSTHGYDNVDPTRISPELGGEDGFKRLSESARAHGLGLLLDIVPNHMATHPTNSWWSDVLRQGRRSVHADAFDIDWDAPGCDGKLWLAVLDRPLADALQGDVLSLEIGTDGPCLRHHDRVLPLSPLSHPADPDSWPSWVERCQRSPQRMEDLLQRQAYRLAWWRSGGDLTNYRRFFDINELVALRVERPAVFDAVHALPLRLVAEGRVDGLRVDHVDGLADPAGYLQTLRAALDDAALRSGRSAGQVTLHVEKILADGERLPAGWTCSGTTGYDFMDEAGALLHAADAEPELQSMWEDCSGDGRSFDLVQQDARGGMLQGSLRCDLDRLLRQLQQQTGAALASADLTPAMIERSVIALLRHFPVYRTHGLQSAADSHWLDQAMAAAAAQLGGGDRTALDRVAATLRDAAGDPQGVLTRFEQLAAPLNAKAVEDTAFYRYARLLSRNDVGSDPGRIHLPWDEFLSRAEARRTEWPQALLAVATHDHKRGPDARCRLAVLSWNVAAWAGEQARFSELAAEAGQPVPLPPAETSLLWQTLLGSWPLAAEALDAGYMERVKNAVQKSLREGKRVSSWADPDSVAEQAVSDWLDWLEGSPAASALRSVFGEFVQQVAPLAARLGLVQTTLQYVSPGVPDLYQGNEGWDHSMVDPDNRRAVDYTQRRSWLTAHQDWRQALQHWTDGTPKALLMARLLGHRAVHPELYAQAPLQYLPQANGTDEGTVHMLLRRHGDVAVLAVVELDARFESRTGAGLADPAVEPLGRVQMPPGAWRSLLDDRRLQGGDAIDAATVLEGSPVAIWVTDEGEHDGR